MRAALVCDDIIWHMGAASMSINKKDIFTATDGNTYSFSGFGGVSNCSRCDAYDQVNEYDRQDGLVVFMCNKCENRLHI